MREPTDEVFDLQTVPIIGRVAAGQPILAEENIIGEVLSDSRATRSGRCFALEVHSENSRPRSRRATSNPGSSGA